MSKLKELQKAIDRCDNKQGCLAYCSLKRQEGCKKVKDHSDYIALCIEKGIDVFKW